MTTQKPPRSLYDMVVDYTSALNVPRRQRLCEFLDVQEQTIRCWQRKKSIPSGVRALKMHYLLEHLGETNSDWKITEQAVIDVGRLVSFKVLTLDAVIAEFKGRFKDDHSVIRMLCGHTHIKADNLDIFQKISDDHGQHLESAISDWSDLMILDGRGQLIAELSNRLAAVLPLCEQIMSDDWTSEERHDLRQRSGQDTIFRLYNALGALCGEKARQHTLKGAAASLVINR
jgi:hypothetical protein